MAPQTSRPLPPGGWGAPPARCLQWPRWHGLCYARVPLPTVNFERPPHGRPGSAAWDLENGGLPGLQAQQATSARALGAVQAAEQGTLRAKVHRVVLIRSRILTPWSTGTFLNDSVIGRRSARQAKRYHTGQRARGWHFFVDVRCWGARFEVWTGHGMGMAPTPLRPPRRHHVTHHHLRRHLPSCRRRGRHHHRGRDAVSPEARKLFSEYVLALAKSGPFPSDKAESIARELWLHHGVSVHLRLAEVRESLSRLPLRCSSGKLRTVTGMI